MLYIFKIKVELPLPKPEHVKIQQTKYPGFSYRNLKSEGHFLESQYHLRNIVMFG